MRKRDEGVMRPFPRYRPIDELRHWRHCERCGKRFSELNMVWIDTQGWFCGKCQLTL